MKTPVATPPQSDVPRLRRSPVAKAIRVFRRLKRLIAMQRSPWLARTVCQRLLTTTDQSQQERCQRIVQTRLTIAPKQLQRFFDTAVGSILMAWLAHFFQGSEQQRAVLETWIVQMAHQPEGFSLLGLMRRIPKQLHLNFDQCLLAAERVQWLLQDGQTTLEHVRALSQQEAQMVPPLPGAMPDFSAPGSFEVTETFFDWTRTSDPLRRLHGHCYQPMPWPKWQVPIVVQSHGLAASPGDLGRYGRHLASHGYFVMAPQHPGSDLQQMRRMLNGEDAKVFKPSEFSDRPLDVSAMLDAVARQNQATYGGHLDLSRVGIMGQSFGAYTALALAGAQVNSTTLATACDLPKAAPNPSLLLQCQALTVPQPLIAFRDLRIVAVLSIDSVGSELFGPIGLQSIRIPVMLVAGSHDIAAPLALEQIRLFRWLQTRSSYLAVIEGKPHVHHVKRLMENLSLQITPLKAAPVPQQPAPFDDYLKALSTVFFGVHLRQTAEIVPYLNARYSAAISRSPFELWLISQTSHATINQTLDQHVHSAQS